MSTKQLIPTLFASAAMTLTFGTMGIHLSEDHPVTRAYALDSTGRVLDSADISASGEYTFKSLKAGEYDILITGESDNRKLTDIRIESGMILRLHNQKPAVSNIRDLRGATIADSSYRITGSPVRHVAMRGSRADASATFVDGMRIISGEAAPAVESERILSKGSEPALRKTRAASGIEMEDAARPDPGSDPGAGSGSIAPGQITAGLWRDLDNWDKWLTTQKNENIAKWQSIWGFFPDNRRFGITVQDKAGKPLIGATVRLLSSPGGVQWQAVTDNQGNADLFHLLNAEVKPEVVHSFELHVIHGDDSAVFRKIRSGGAGRETYRVEFGKSPVAVADIAFVVDATGSMGDEIRYLQSELTDVISRVQRGNQCVTLRTASVFYRDHGDEYVTRKSDFSTDPLQTVGFIQEQSANGGGDFPEAVDAALETTITKLTWSPSALAKVAFLLLDAPPHQDAASKEKMQKFTKLAAANGITIVPVVASGIDLSTEFLMKYLSISTGGAYIYITDHSGIGGSHLKPTGVKENKNYLNDLMVSFIEDRLKWEGCKKDTAYQPQERSEILSNGQWQVQVFPNPATDHLQIRSNEMPDRIEIWTASGSRVSASTQNSLVNRLDLKALASGMYIVKIIRKEEVLSCRILVMR